MTDETRIRLLEADADKTDDRYRELDARLDKIMGILTGLLVATTTAAILLALNLVVAA